MMRIVMLHIILFFVGYVYSQSVPSINFTTNDGLPANYVYGVTEDAQGNIWAYTENGVSKYDGYQWKNFGANDGLGGKDIIRGISHADGNIYFESFDERQIYSMQDEKFEALEYNNAGLIRHRNNPLILGSTYSYFIHPDGSFQKYNRQVNNSIISKNEVRFEFADDVIRLVREQSRWSLHIKERKWALPYLDDLQNVAFEQIRIINIQGKDFCLIKTNTSLHIHDLETNRNLNLASFIENIKKRETVLYFSRPESVIFYTSFGFIELDKEMKVIDSMRYKDMFEGIEMRNAYKDKEDNLWLGSIERGLFLIPKSYRQIKRLTTSGKLPKSIEGLVKSDNGDIYAATDNLRIYKIVNSKLKLLDFPEKRENYNAIIPYGDGKIMYSATSKLEVDEDMVALIKKLNILDTLAVSSYSSSYSGPHYKINKRYIINSNGILIIGKQEGKLIKQEEIYSTQLSATMHLKMHPFGDTCFVGQCNQFYCITEDTVIRTSLTDDDYIESVAYVDDHRVLLGLKKGLIVYDYVVGRMLCRIDAQNVKALARGSNHEFFAIVDNTLHQYVLKDDTLALAYIYTTFDGIPRSRLLDIEWKDDHIYLASETELSIIPENFKHSERQKPVAYPQPKLKLLGSDFDNVKREYAHNQNSFLIDHKVVHPASLGQIQYQYQLSPVMSSMNTTYEPQLSFFSLPPGKYTYQVKAIAQNNTEYNLEPLEFVIKNPFYATTWFIGLLLLSILGMLLYFHNRKIKLHLQELQFQKTINDLKLNAIQSQMNPHFIFNALGSIQYFIQTRNIEKADEYLADFAVLIRKILNTSVQKFITLEEELDLLRLYTKLEDIRFDHKIKIDFDVSDNLDYDFLLPPMIIQPFVENAINHGLFHLEDRKGQLTISFTMQGDALECVVTDNGIGREASKSYKLSKGHKPRGLKITEEKIEAIRRSDNLNIQVNIEDLYDNDKACGTRVHILFNAIN